MPRATTRGSPGLAGFEPALPLVAVVALPSKSMLKWRSDMENALDATMILFNVMGGLGLFFIGVGLLWFVQVYRDKGE